VPWRLEPLSGSVPCNLLTGETYRGINFLLLASLRYPDNYFLTEADLETLNTKPLRKAPKHEILVQDEHGEPACQTVFHVSTIENIPENLLPQIKGNISGIRSCSEVVEQMPDKPYRRHFGNKPYYDWQKDLVTMPFSKKPMDFQAYYISLFRLLIHSTGHPRRLNRDCLKELKHLVTYAVQMENTVADIALYFLSHYAAFISTVEWQDSYTHGLLAKHMKKDASYIFTACEFAQAAVDYILNQGTVIQTAQVLHNGASMA
jgi:antirestriction protein ArdC